MCYFVCCVAIEFFCLLSKGNVLRMYLRLRSARQIVRSYTRSLGSPLQDSRKFGREVWASFARGIDLALHIFIFAVIFATNKNLRPQPPTGERAR